MLTKKVVKAILESIRRNNQELDKDIERLALEPDTRLVDGRVVKI